LIRELKRSSGHLSQPLPVFSDFFCDPLRNKSAFRDPVHHRQNRRAPQEHVDGACAFGQAGTQQRESYTIYLNYAPSYSATYGNLGAEIVLMLWLAKKREGPDKEALLEFPWIKPKDDFSVRRFFPEARVVEPTHRVRAR